MGLMGPGHVTHSIGPMGPVALPIRRARCYECFRPIAHCFCSAIPSIANRTAVLIVQHRRESFHPFNTARIVRKALQNSLLIVDHTPRIAERLVLKPGAALLYPGPRSTLLSELPPDRRPAQLVVVDGTWHQVKTLVRELTALRELPQYRLAPATPSTFRIRKEPNDLALSTVEAVVAALREFEPDTHGFEQLLEAFDVMVERQLSFPKPADGVRRVVKGSKTIVDNSMALPIKGPPTPTR